MTSLVGVVPGRGLGPRFAAYGSLGNGRFPRLILFLLFERVTGLFRVLIKSFFTHADCEAVPLLPAAARSLIPLLNMPPVAIFVRSLSAALSSSSVSSSSFWASP